MKHSTFGTLLVLVSQLGVAVGAAIAQIASENWPYSAVALVVSGASILCGIALIMVCSWCPCRDSGFKVSYKFSDARLL